MARTESPLHPSPEQEEGEVAELTDESASGPESAASTPDGDSDAASAPTLAPSEPIRLLGPVVSCLLEPLLAILPIVLFVLPAVGVALVRAPVYSAEARAVVGRQDTSANAIPGYASAVQQLASNYSRLITAQAVTQDLQQTLKLQASQIDGHVSASPIPQSPLIRVTADAPTPSAAVALANGATSSLVTYISRTVGSGAQPADLLSRYNKAETDLINAQAAAISTQAALTLAGNNSVVGPGAQAAYVRAQAAVATAQLAVNAATTAYNDAVSNSTAAPITVVSPAVAASSNRKSTIEVDVALAVVAGGILGVLLATWRANRAALRQIRSQYHLRTPASA